MKQYFYERECQSPELREQSLLERLPAFITYAKQECQHYGQFLQHIDAEKITSRELLAQLPITRKSDLMRLQAKDAPLGGLNAKTANLGRIFQSPGPIYDPENTSDDWWRMGQAFYAAGFSTGDLVQNCLSYHLTPGGFILDSGASKLGLESTIIDVRGPRPRLLRPGIISAEDVIGVLGTRPLPPDGATMRAPGLLARHYAPNTPARLLSRKEILMLAKGSSGLGVLSRENIPTRFLGDWRVMPQDPINYGEQLYANLRNLDREGIVEILIENVPDEAAWAAIYDRLARATRR